ncbi:MAG: hypothetical protein J6X99_07045 [Bacteroidales bacterium]|nr:hypothetical protein [Bacteroidales bacterium]
MKHMQILFACLLAVVSCIKETAPDTQETPGKEQVTIRVAMSQDTFTKVSFTDQDGKLALAWQDTDCIRVISGENSEVFTISKIISDHEAEFTGNAVPGTSFDILFPGTYVSVEEAEDDTASPTQVGNGSTAHLGYRALLSDVDSYENIAFTKTWAEEHDGTLNQGAAIKMVLKLPEGVSTLKSAGIGLGGTNYTLQFSGVDVSASGQILTAYMMLPWNDIDLADGSQIPLYVMDTDNEVYSRTLSISGDKTIKQGSVNSFGGTTPIDNIVISNFVSGNGTEENPYLIANARQLNNMHSVMLNNSSNWFRLLEDIDATPIENWAPLNNASPYSKAMDFDGDGHVIFNLKSTDATYSSFAGVLNGHIHDVSFVEATISGTTRVGVVAGYIGTTGVVGNCTNVHVISSSVAGGATFAGGFAGEINTTGTIEYCSAQSTTVTGTDNIGEFAGIVRGQVATIRGCYTSDFTLVNDNTPSALKGLGGFVGCTTANAIFENCDVLGTVSITSNATPDGDKKLAVGGFIGYSAAAAPVFKNCDVFGTEVVISGNSETGGFVGYNDRSASYSNCSVIAVKVSGVNHLGGFMGYGGVSSGYEVPSIFTDCLVDGVEVTQNLASASGSIHTGGFAGYSGQALSYINCRVRGVKVDATKAAVQNVGGFVGCTAYAGSNFQNCSVDMGTTVTAKANSVGGFVGWAYVPDAYKDCSSAATVTVTGSTQNTGGFVGYASGSATFTNCAATGYVNSQNVYVGGFVGKAENASFVSCHYSNGVVTSTANGNNAQIGGFVGQAHSNSGFNGCYVHQAQVVANTAGRTGGFAGQLGYNSTGGNGVTTTNCIVQDVLVDGALNTGGFVGVQYETITRSYVANGSVTAHNNQVGGFSAFVQNGNITDCYTTTAVNGGSYNDVGGFIGLLYYADVQNCFSAGMQYGDGTNRAAFVAKCALQGTAGSISNCIGWHESLPFCGSNTVGATIENVYAGKEDTISDHAIALGWSSTIWDLSGSVPLLVPGDVQINAVFVGDSITWQWARVSKKDSQASIIEATHGVLGNEPLPSYMSISGTTITTRFHPGFFSSNGYVDKGISGQNTTQMRARFEKDVIALNPKVFVIMGGTNDIAQGVSEDDIYANIAWMADQARAAGMKVVVCSITPNNRNYGTIGWKSVYIESLNEKFQTLCTTEGYTYCDYWNALVARNASEAAVETDIDHGLKDAYKLYDDLHPGPDAYTVMEGIVKPIIDELL